MKHFREIIVSKAVHTANRCVYLKDCFAFSSPLMAYTGNQAF